MSFKMTINRYAVTIRDSDKTIELGDFISDIPRDVQISAYPVSELRQDDRGNLYRSPTKYVPEVTIKFKARCVTIEDRRAAERIPADWGMPDIDCGPNGFSLTRGCSAEHDSVDISEYVEPGYRIETIVDGPEPLCPYEVQVVATLHPETILAASD